MKLLLIVFAISWGIVARAQDIIFQLRPENNAVTCFLTNDLKITLCSAKLFYKNSDGDMVPSNERYIIEQVNGVYPKIVDKIDGFSIKLQLSVNGSNNSNHLYAFFFAGGNQYGVKVYKIDGIDIVGLKTQPPSSNMRSVKLAGNEIVIRNEWQDTNGINFICTERYEISGNDCKFINKTNSMKGSVLEK